MTGVCDGKDQKKKGWWRRFLERLAKANMESAKGKSGG